MGVRYDQKALSKLALLRALRGRVHLYDRVCMIGWNLLLL
jgi:hypothetical protein